jgi:hypothetical protein
MKVPAVVIPPEQKKNPAPKRKKNAPQTQKDEAEMTISKSKKGKKLTQLKEENATLKKAVTTLTFKGY